MVKQAEIYNNQRRHCSLGDKTPEFAHVNQIHKYKSYKKNKSYFSCVGMLASLEKILKDFSKLHQYTSTINYF
jgi:hypothetical protein